jgi:hypothetical protein
MRVVVVVAVIQGRKVLAVQALVAMAATTYQPRHNLELRILVAVVVVALVIIAIKRLATAAPAS